MVSGPDPDPKLARVSEFGIQSRFRKEQYAKKKIEYVSWFDVLIFSLEGGLEAFTRACKSLKKEHTVICFSDKQYKISLRFFPNFHVRKTPVF